MNDVLSITLAVAVLLGSVATRPPPIIECPGTNVHVWNRDQCERLKPAPTGGGGGGCSGGLSCVVGGLLGSIGL